MKFTAHMIKYLDSLINDGPFYGVIVLKNTNKRSKQRDAWTYVTNKFNEFFGTNFDNELVRKKYTYEQNKVRKKAVARVEFEKAKSFTEFKRVNNKTGGAGLAFSLLTLTLTILLMKTSCHCHSKRSCR